MLNKKLANFYKILQLIFIGLAIFGCAAQQQPQGGPRDVTPPKLVKATPPNKTRNFAAKQVIMEFDEFIKLTNQYQEVSISPTQDRQPEFSANKKILKIQFKDTLQKNTTYVINFGKAIQDVNESNILKNFTYVLSTGPHIDSLSISGTVTNTVTQEREKDVTVFIFPVSQDSLLFGKKKPMVYTTTDSSGNFALNNLKEADYRIYALKEPSPDKIFNNDNELIAFLKKPIHLHTDTAYVKLNLFKQVPEKFRFVEKRFDTDGKMFFSFNRSLNKPGVKILYPSDLNQQKYVDFNRTNDTASIYVKNMGFDSIRVAFYDNNKPVDTTYLLKGRKESFQRSVGFEFNTNNDNQLKPGTDLKVTSTLPIDLIDNSYITLNEDSSAVDDYTLLRDTSNFKKFSIRYRWKENSRYELIFSENALTTIYGDKNKKYIKKFTINKEENYNTLTAKMVLPDTSKAYVVELLTDKKVVLQSDPIIRNTSIVYKNYLTGKYYIRVVYDTNKNGKWDSGNVRLRIQPENIWLNDKLITLRPNLEVEEIITVPREVPSP